jgi:hypothetical protein
VRHGGGRWRVQIDELKRITESSDGLVNLHEALTRFATDEPQKAKLFELRFFAGLSVAEPRLHGTGPAARPECCA